MARTNPPRRQENRDAPSARQSGMNQLIIACIIFVAGFLSGVAFTVFRGDMAPAPGTAQIASQDSGAGEEMRQAILHLEAEVTANPQNFQAWTRLGNLYYDTQQPQKAIAAYTKSLELHEGDANILTDLGVMYRQVDQPQKAIDMFNKAMEKDPTHLPSRYNKGIVLMYDLNDPQGAIASWKQMLKINPEAKAGNGESIREMIARIEKEQASAKQE